MMMTGQFDANCDILVLPYLVDTGQVDWDTYIVESEITFEKVSEVHGFRNYDFKQYMKYVATKCKNSFVLSCFKC